MQYLSNQFQHILEPNLVTAADSQALTAPGHLIKDNAPGLTQGCELPGNTRRGQNLTKHFACVSLFAE